MPKHRTEKDSLGSKQIPSDALYGIQTMRASENFQISGERIFPEFVRASAQVKHAAAMANMATGDLDKKLGNAIVKAALEVERGQHMDQFIVDVFQAGAGTSHNMNMNEVIAHRASRISGKKVHPNDEVNMSQSTNDFYPTTMRICAYQMLQQLLPNLAALEKSFAKKAREFRSIRKSGRTHLQDAVPMTLGQEFGAYVACISHHRADIAEAMRELTEVGFGGTAVGTGLNASAAYRRSVIGALKKTTEVPVRATKDYFFAMWGMTPFVRVSGAIKNLALDLSKIANDLRLLSSGPRTGLNEINIPPVQPGSSIMPGKVNPVICECLNMICFQVLGNDTTISYASQAGQLQINVMMPVINYNLLQSIKILTSGAQMFQEKCIDGITANKRDAEHYADSTMGLATILNPIIGYDKAADMAKESVKTGIPIKDLILSNRLMTEAEWIAKVEKSA